MATSRRAQALLTDLDQPIIRVFRVKCQAALISENVFRLGNGDL
jgi:hypothetical protein